MQFQQKSSTDPSTTSSSSVIKRTVHTVNKSQPKKSDVITIKRSSHQTKKSTITSHTSSNSTNQRRKEVIKDVQQMTLYQSQADLITPDTDCGPRRMYQKTEFHDGEKRIEILEIVECIDSSCSSTPEEDDRSPVEDDQHSSSSFYHTSRSSKSSKIPIPVFKSSTQPNVVPSATPQRKSNRENSAGKIYVKNIHNNNSKVDQMIADLLIEALNHPKELGIELINSPKDRGLLITAGSGISLTGTNAMKRPSISRRGITGSRRSANSSKYQQTFEVIPEEKSSISVDSSNDEINIKKSKHYKIKETSLSNSEGDGDRPKKMSRGKLAVESDSTNESEAWIGFFKQHDESTNEGTILLFA